MKLAQALITRADMQTRMRELQQRLCDNAIVQEGEACAEDPNEMLGELEALSAKLEKLIVAINLTNAHVEQDGETLTAMLARRDCMKQRIGALSEVIRYASMTGERARGSEIKILPAVPVRELRANLDRQSAELRCLDMRIQELNWTSELEEL
ncbi:MAG: DIP1984 family protein [Candidatus Fimadaptatus sp.]|jgi:hypothetical protein